MGTLRLVLISLSGFFLTLGTAFAIDQANLDLRLVRTHELEHLRISVYSQYIDGFPVEGSHWRLVEGNAEGPWIRLLENGRLAPNPIQAQPQNFQSIPALDAMKGFELEGKAELVYLFETDEMKFPQPRRCWKALYSHTDLTQPRRETVFVDDETGEILWRRNEIHFYNYSGRVTGGVLSGLDPDDFVRPLTRPGLSGSIVTELGDQISVETNSTGNFTIPNVRNPRTYLQAHLSTMFFGVFDTMIGNYPSLYREVNEGQSSEFAFGQVRSEFETANVNALYQLTRVRNFVTSLVPGFPGADSYLTVRTNINSQCNAYFTPGSVNFYRQGQDCPNMAYSTILAHEYGHHFVESLGLSQGSFGEGFADTLALLAYGTEVVGSRFYLSGENLREPAAADIDYPCTQGIHACGQALAGLWSNIRSLWARSHPDEAKGYLNLFARWALITSGGDQNDAAHPQTAIEVLTADANGANYRLGSKHAVTICRSFLEHNIGCPNVGRLGVLTSPPNVTTTTPNLPFGVQATLDRESMLIGDVSARLYYRVAGEEEFQSLNMFREGKKIMASIPAQPCVTEIEYFIEITSSGKNRLTLPEFAPQALSKVYFAVDRNELRTFQFNSEGDHWTADNRQGSRGAWSNVSNLNGDPVGPYSGTDDSGYFWTTTNGRDPWLLGTVNLKSPAVWGVPGRILTAEFDYFARHRFPNEQDFDVVQVIDGRDREVLSELPDTVWRWKAKRVTFNSGWFSAGTEVQMEIHADVRSMISIFRGAIDNVRLQEFSCTVPICSVDFNGSGEMDSEDVSIYMHAYMSGQLVADLNQDEHLDGSDIALFWNEWHAGCR